MPQNPDQESEGIIWGFPENSGTPKSSILIGFSIMNRPFWGSPYFWKHPYMLYGIGTSNSSLTCKFLKGTCAELRAFPDLYVAQHDKGRATTNREQPINDPIKSIKHRIISHLSGKT